jgi:hypothetical protein
MQRRRPTTDTGGTGLRWRYRLAAGFRPVGSEVLFLRDAAR